MYIFYIVIKKYNVISYKCTLCDKYFKDVNVLVFK